MTTIAVLLTLCALPVAALIVALSTYRKVGPNQVLVVSGRRGTYVDPATGEAHEKSFRIYHGGGTFVLPILHKVDVMSVELMTLEIRTPEFFTKFGVPIVVDAIAQIKVRSDEPAALATAAEMFLSKTAREMNEIAHQMMQGHLRAVISTLPFEEIHANPEAFAQNVQRLTAADLAHMGIEVVSFTIREVRDPSGYLQALGRPQLADVQKNASVGEANAARDAGIGRAHAEREASVTAAQARQASDLARIEAELAVAAAQADKDRRVHDLSSTVAEAKADSDLAYDVASVRAQMKVLVERQKMQELEVRSKELELAATIAKPAEAERRRVETIAEAERTRARILAEAEAESARLRGRAEADMIRERGAAEAERAQQLALAEAAGLRAKLEAEAEGMMRKAEAWQRYNSAALGQLWIEKLPEVAAAVAAPLAKIDRIVLVGQGGEGAGLDRITRGITDVIAQLPALAELASGVGVEQLLARATSPAREERSDGGNGAERR